MEKQVKEMIGGRVGGEGDTLRSFVLLSTTERTLIIMKRTSRSREVRKARKSRKSRDARKAIIPINVSE